jgi:formate dehydrogenase subunit gamma
MQNGSREERKRRGYRRALKAAAVIFAFVLVAPLIPYALAAAGVQVPDPGADLWREVRQRVPQPNMTTQVQGVDSAMLINPWGETWRQFRADKLVPIGGWILLAMTGIITVFYLVRGPLRIAEGKAGKLVPRFSVNQRVVHWFTAALFLILGITGLVLLYGRYVLIPVLGPAGFSATAAACKEIHNLFGPIFPVAILTLIFLLGRGNGCRRVDLKWFLKAGGFFGAHPADSGYYNGGEKSWFWMTVLFGLIISASGLVLDFPLFGQGREMMEIAHFAHGVIAVLFITASLGHIYIGTIGMEGASKAMTQGYVDANWAKEHHNLWYDEMEKAGMVGVAPNALEEVKRHDDADFRGFSAPTPKLEKGG